MNQQQVVSRELENKNDQTEADATFTVLSIRFLIRKEARNHVGDPNNMYTTTTQYFERIKQKMDKIIGVPLLKGKELFISGGREEIEAHKLYMHAFDFIHIIGVRKALNQ